MSEARTYMYVNNDDGVSDLFPEDQDVRYSINPLSGRIEQMMGEPDDRPFLRKLSKGTRNAVMSGGLTAVGWIVGKKYHPEYVFLYAIIGSTVGNVLSELLD